MWTNLIPWGISFVMLIFSVMTYARNGSNDKKVEMMEENDRDKAIQQSLIKMDVKIDQLCSTTNETRSDIKAMNSKVSDLDKEVAIVKRDIKTAFTQIDELRRVTFNDKVE